MPSLLRPRSSGSTTTRPRTEVVINIYDLLPPGRLSSILWTVGSSLLHSGVVVKDREYAFGGHSKRDTTGVYYTCPRFEPPGGTFRCSLSQGFTDRSDEAIDKIVREVSEEFLGPRYNLLTNNCNHFTSVLSERLTGRAAPSWLNRAASIGIVLPCFVPKEWISPPDFETVDGELVDECAGDECVDGDATENMAMLNHQRRTSNCRAAQPARLVGLKDSGRRDLPAAERAPLPRHARSSG
ncbi:DUF862-domain-containing protein [Piedraia hortae CBS 480.64]|uniref:DUF862-domain-containing protein n=1 Tax=Piedraia hortae CBS 480.64 TaxID=1314780 RepID=A0A6A7BYS1_9PEZI|nr:DUF862-domain-containing protein [Piedraia hortae CBS 480.64]